MKAAATMTERLYYNDAKLREFDAKVMRSEPCGDGIGVWLDRTAFYPTSGGQPFDVGTLGSDAVVGVEEDGGDIVHLLPSRAVPPIPGSTAHGMIDWARRFDHMQQHTGQHVLSAVLERLFKARTLSFHLGAAASTIDLDRELSQAERSRGELEANQVVWNDVPAVIRYVSEDEARTLPLRKEPARSGTLRVIDIEAVDLSACGGTHVARTGEIGQIAMSSWERFKGGQRLEFVCGGRALARHGQLRDVTASATGLLSVVPAELPAAIDRLQGESKELRRALMTAHGQLAIYEAAALSEDAEPMGASRLLLRVIDGDAHRLKALAAAVVSRPGLLTVLVSARTPALAVAARSPDLALSCQEIIVSLTTRFGGRGGGKPDFAQCGGLQGEPDAVLAAAKQVILTRGAP
jgi:alanyl-tRNA synthetase